MTISDDLKFIQRYDNSPSRGATKQALVYGERIEAKSGVLLTHVSMMIALTGIIFVITDSGSILQLVVGLELIIYLALATACIWCQSEIPQDLLLKLKNENLGATQEKLSPLEKKMAKHIQSKERVFLIIQKSLYVMAVTLAITIAWSLGSLNYTNIIELQK